MHNGNVVVRAFLHVINFMSHHRSFVHFLHLMVPQYRRRDALVRLQRRLETNIGIRDP